MFSTIFSSNPVLALLPLIIIAGTALACIFAMCIGMIIITVREEFNK